MPHQSENFTLAARRHDIPSVSQRRGAHLYFGNRKNSITRWSEFAIAMNFKPGLDFRRLDQAFRHTILRHPELASIFRSSADGGLIVDRLPIDRFALDAQDTVHMDEGEFIAHLHDDADAGFDIARGPLIVLRAYRRPDQSTSILLHINHLVTDGWSTEIVLGCLIENYIGAAAPAKPGADISFEDFVDWEDDIATGDFGRQHHQFWHRELDSMSGTIQLPAPAAEEAKGPRTSANLRSHIDEPTTKALRQAAQRSGATVFSSLFACYTIALSRLCRAGDIPVMTMSSQRFRPGLEKLVGFVAVGVCLRARMNPDITLEQHVQTSTRTVEAAMSHHTNIWNVAYERKLADPTFGGNLFDQFSFQKWSAQVNDNLGFSNLLFDPASPSLRFGDLQIRPIRLDRDISFKNITFGYIEGHSRIFLDAFYKRSAVSPDAVAQLMEDFHHVLKLYISSPESHVAQALNFTR